MADQPGMIRFGVFEVNLAAGELRKNGARVKLQEQPFQVLAALLECPGEIVTKEELKDRLWAGDTFVDFDHSLSTAVNKIREALGDSATSPRFIETIPRKGYRFVGFSAEVPARAGSQSSPRLRFVNVAGRRWWVWGLTVAAPVVLLTALLLRRPIEPVVAPGAMRPVPLTSFPGREIYPALSPDGTRVAFSWDGEDGSGNFDIYVQVVGTDAPVPLTKHLAPDLDPSWSPDGRYLAFARQIATDRMALVRIPAIGGGQESTITEAANPSLQPVGRNHYLAWHPSGEGIVFADRQAKAEPLALYLYRLESGQRERLTRPPDGSLGDVSPSLSADGKTLVFMRYPSASQSAIHALGLDAMGMPQGPSREVVALPFVAFGAVLTPTSQEIVFSRRWVEAGLVRVELSGRSSPRRLMGIEDVALTPGFSADGKRLVYSRHYGHLDIWRLELSSPGMAAGQPQPWIYSTQADLHADYSPGGSKIVFQSNRSGTHQIWVSDEDGSNAERLTSLEASLTGTPRWSRDGTRIAFDSNASGGSDIYVMNSSGAGVTRLTKGAVQAHSPRWSRDGKWIYFAEGVSQPMGLWRIPVAGGEAERIAEDSYGRPFFSSDGRYVYHRKGDHGLWRVAAEGGEEERVLESILSNASFAVVPEGIYYTPATPTFASADILFHRFADGSVTTVWHSPQSAPDRFGISPDGRFLLFTLPKELGYDLVMVEGFQ